MWYTYPQQRVMEIQQSKRDLAGVLLGPHDGSLTDDNLGLLQVRNYITYRPLLKVDFLIAAPIVSLAFGRSKSKI
jgi:hypothetical protein